MTLMQQNTLLEATSIPPTTSVDNSFIFVFEQSALLQKCMHLQAVNKQALKDFFKH